MMLFALFANKKSDELTKEVRLCLHVQLKAVFLLNFVEYNDCMI